MRVGSIKKCAKTYRIRDYIVDNHILDDKISTDLINQLASNFDVVDRTVNTAIHLASEKTGKPIVRKRKRIIHMPNQKPVKKEHCEIKPLMYSRDEKKKKSRESYVLQGKYTNEMTISELYKELYRDTTTQKRLCLEYR